MTVALEPPFDPARDLEVTRLMAAPPETVWRAYAEAELLKRWWTPHPVVTRHAEVALQPGGRFHTIMVIPDHGEQSMDFCILDVVPQRRLVWTDMMSAGFHPVKPMFGFTAVVTLTPEGAGTRYRAVAMHRQAESRSRHEEMGFHDGWGTVTAQLDALTAAM